jgi:hypothetical protein
MGGDSKLSGRHDIRRNISCISFRSRRGRAHSGRLSTLWREPGGVSLLILKTRALLEGCQAGICSIVSSAKCLELCQ